MTNADDVMMAVKKAWDSLGSNGKPNNGEYTVLAAFVACITTESSEELHVLSLGTGTKCAGKSILEEDKIGCILCDSHAEVIAKRGLQKYLIDCMINLVNKPCNGNDNYNAITFASNDNVSIFKLKDSWKIIFFISENPCGDASIFEHKDGNNNFTGAKLINNNESLLWTRENTQELGLLRFKSGRSDIPDKYKTTSLSCSDKISRWLFLGVQGSFLSLLISSVQISKVVVAFDILSASAIIQYTALKRAIIDRLLLPNEDNRMCTVEVTSSPFDCKGISTRYDDTNKKLTASGTSLNWIKIVESDHGIVEVTLARTGSLQGSVKQSVGRPQSTSRLSRLRLSHSFLLLLQKILKIQDNFKVNKLRQELEFHNNSETLTDEGLSDKTFCWLKNAPVNYRKLRHEFLSHDTFCKWVCDTPLTFSVSTYGTEASKFSNKRKRDW
jgi:tRNA-specific adenosine deaminase 1